MPSRRGWARRTTRKSYFEDPEALSTEVPGFVDAVTDRGDGRPGGSRARTTSSPSSEPVSLYPFCRISEVIERVNPSIPGRMLVFFPGEYSNNVYRLLNARDGWNYMAVPITAG